MLEDGTYTAVVDRIEDGLATLVVEEDGRDVDDLVLDVDELPEEAQRADAVVRVELVDGELAGVTDDEAATRERKEDAQSRFDRLSERPPESDEE